MTVSFNDKQKEAIEYIDHPLLVVAGAGSGKTLIISHKVSYLIKEKGFTPHSILAITFTNKATSEMKERITLLIGEAKSQPYISTFHAFCGDVLRHHFDKIGGSNRYSIFDSNDQRRLIKQILSDLKADEKEYSSNKVISIIEQLKNSLQSPQDYHMNTEKDTTIATVYETYQTFLSDNKAIDFTGMLFFTYKLFKAKPDILSLYQEKYKYILVDEYQDTNKVQYHLIKMIASKYNNLTAVGDFDQNIYSWRGASTQHILNFETDYNPSKVIIMEQNYRSTQPILSVANELIKHNTERKEKQLWTKNKQGNAVVSYACKNEQEESLFITNEIRKLSQTRKSENKSTTELTQLSYKEIVILYRINAMSRVLEEQLTLAQIPYQIVGGLRFFDRKEIKDIIAYLQLIYNSENRYALSRVINTPTRQIGTTTLKKLINLKKHYDCKFEDVLKEDHGFNARTLKALKSFFDMMQSFRQHQFKKDIIGQLIEVILTKVDFKEFLKKEGEKIAQDKLENIYELISFSREEELSLGDFLNKLSLHSDMDHIKEEENRVTLMTMHHAKGLEYDAVFIVGCEEGTLPHYKALGHKDQIEEERRLCYVGITRGKKHVYMTWCKERTLFGNLRYQEKSRFINNISPSLLKQENSPTLQTQKNRFPSETTIQFDQFDVPFQKVVTQLYQTGELVKHSAWGMGTIIHIDGKGENAVLHINFNGNKKKLISKYAPLTKMSTS